MLKFTNVFIKSLKQFEKFLSVFLNIFFISLLILSVPSHKVVAADHAHFYSEVSRLSASGKLLMSREYRSDAPGSEAAREFTSVNSHQEDRKPCVFGSECAYYDEDIDGFVLAWVPCYTEANVLENDFPSTGGVVWSQAELWVDQEFINDLPIESDDGTPIENNKMLRFHNELEIGCGDANTIDLLYFYYNFGTGDKSYYFHGYSMCGQEERPVQFVSTTNLGDQWTRWTFKWDFSKGTRETWVTTMSGETTKLEGPGLAFNGQFPGLNPNTEMNSLRPLSHSTKRQHYPTCNNKHPNYRFGYRNFIVSTEPINFVVGTPSPDPSPEEPPSVVPRPTIEYE